MNPAWIFLFLFQSALAFAFTFFIAKTVVKPDHLGSLRLVRNLVLAGSVIIALLVFVALYFALPQESANAVGAALTPAVWVFMISFAAGLALVIAETSIRRKAAEPEEKLSLKHDRRYWH